MNGMQFAIALSLLFCGFMIINMQITTIVSLWLVVYLSKRSEFSQTAS